MVNPVSKRLFGLLVLLLFLPPLAVFLLPRRNLRNRRGSPRKIWMCRSRSVRSWSRRRNARKTFRRSGRGLDPRGEDLKVITTGGADVRALSGRVPSLIMESSFGRAFPRFYIRGLGNTDFDLNASQPVSMVVDEVVLENPVVKGMPLFDIQQVEVLRGPQGTLFGRNTPAGIVKFETVKPSQEFDAFVRASYGTYRQPTSRRRSVVRSAAACRPASPLLYQGRERLGEQRLHRRRRTRRLRRPRPTASSSCGSRTRSSPVCSSSMVGRYDGTARIFRANIIEPGTEQPGRRLPAGSGVARRPQQPGNQLARRSAESGVRFRRRHPDVDHRLREHSTTCTAGAISTAVTVQRSWAKAITGPGSFPFPSESAGAMPSLDQWTQEFRLASNDNEVSTGWWASSISTRKCNIDNFSYDTLAPGNPQNGSRHPVPEDDGLRLFRIAGLAGVGEVGSRRRSALFE